MLIKFYFLFLPFPAGETGERCWIYYLCPQHFFSYATGILWGEGFHSWSDLENKHGHWECSRSVGQATLEGSQLFENKTKNFSHLYLCSIQLSLPIFLFRSLQVLPIHKQFNLVNMSPSYTNQKNIMGEVSVFVLVTIHTSKMLQCTDSPSVV